VVPANLGCSQRGPIADSKVVWSAAPPKLVTGLHCRIETAFTPGEVLLVTEAAGVPGGGTAESSDSIAGGGTLQLISGSVPTQGAAACWSVVTGDGKFKVVTNAGSSTEALFSVSSSGQLTFVSSTSAEPNTAPTDTALTTNDLFLYALDGGAGSISEFRFDESSQTLTLIGRISDGLTANSGLNGLAAY